MSITRRQTLKAGATTLAALAMPVFIPSRVLGRDGGTAPSNRITLGAVGTGGMGMGNLGNLIGHDDCHGLAVCDVDSARRGKAAKAVNDKNGNKDCKEYSDFRELMARTDIDAVLIATPDHWHGLVGLAALNSGKDVYGQKPITHTFAEGLAICEAVKKNNRIWQTGSQQRSSANFRWGVELVLNGHIGKLKHVDVGLPTGKKSPAGKPSEPPKELDYEMWCGPSVKIPYDPQVVHYNWRWNLAYGGGQLMDWVGHHNDIAHWGMGMDSSGPLEVVGTGEFNPKDAIYNDMMNYKIDCVYEGGVTTTITNKNPMGTKWIGDAGWVYVNRGHFEASNPEWTKKDFQRGPIKAYESPNHERNFLDCVKSRKLAICPAETGHRSITPGHLGLVSMLTGRKLKWDPQSQQIQGDDAAQKMLQFTPREPWKLA